MKKVRQPGTDVILTCTNILKRSGATYLKEGYSVIYMDEASFNRDFYLTDLIKMASGEPIFSDKNMFTSPIRCLDIAKVTGHHYNT